MSKHEKNKLYLDEFHNLKGMDNENTEKLSSTYKIKKLDLSKDTDKFSPFDTADLMLQNKEIKAVIHDFYKSQKSAFNLDEVDFTDDIECGYFMYKLEEDLAQKDGDKGLTLPESELFLLLLKNSTEQRGFYSVDLVNKFKGSLKEMEEY